LIKNPSNSSTVFNIPIVKESDTENLCYFYAAFNALPTISQKYALCANNFDNPSAFFLNIPQKRSDYNIKKHEEGFNPTDIFENSSRTWLYQRFSMKKRFSLAMQYLFRPST
jgi:hypothetical protein